MAEDPLETYQGRPAFQADHPDQWRAWLAEHHGDADPGVWLVTWRAGSGHNVPGYEPWIPEALAYGWIDGQASTVDADRNALWFTRRRRGSRWSRLSKERVARVERLFVFDAASHPPIVYQAAALRGARSPDLARRFLAFLQGDAARKLLADAGFALP